MSSSSATFRVAVSQPPGAGLLFDADYTTSSLGGTEAVEHKGTRYEQQVIPGAGPFGQAVFRQINLPNVEGQHSWGFDAPVEAAFPTEASRFLRMRFRMLSGNDYRAVSWADGTSARCVDKFILLGGGTGRWIINAEGEAENATTWGWSLQIDGGVHKVERFGLVNGQWYSIQLELRYGSSACAKLWIDDMSYAAPWLQTSAFAQAPPAQYSNSWRIGGFNNNGLQVGGQFSLEHAELEIGTNFDPNW